MLFTNCRLRLSMYCLEKPYDTRAELRAVLKQSPQGLVAFSLTIERDRFFALPEEAAPRWSQLHCCMHDEHRTFASLDSGEVACCPQARVHKKTQTYYPKSKYEAKHLVSISGTLHAYTFPIFYGRTVSVCPFLF